MGGPGSGRRADRKTTVEECLTLSMKGLAKRGVLRPGAAGTLTWRWAAGDTYRIGFRCDHSGDRPQLWLTYTLSDRITDQRTQCQYAMGLDADPCRFGGHQWYFCCPFCDRRVRLLHMPPGEHTFACRRCYDLTYQCTQAA